VGQHDLSYRLFFTHPRMIQDLLRLMVDEPWVERLDLGSAEQVTASFVSRDHGNHKDRVSDIVWKFRRKDGQEPEVYILVELQSRPDPSMPVRFTAYASLFYQNLLADKPPAAWRNMPPVIPILVYNGGGPWNVSTDLDSVIRHLDPSADVHRLRLQYRLVDESAARLRPAELDPVDGLADLVQERLSFREELMSFLVPSRQRQIDKKILACTGREAGVSRPLNFRLALPQEGDRLLEVFLQVKEPGLFQQHLGGSAGVNHRLEELERLIEQTAGFFEAPLIKKQRSPEPEHFCLQQAVAAPAQPNLVSAKERILGSFELTQDTVGVAELGIDPGLKIPNPVDVIRLAQMFREPGRQERPIDRLGRIRRLGDDDRGRTPAIGIDDHPVGGNGDCETLVRPRAAVVEPAGAGEEAQEREEGEEGEETPRRRLGMNGLLRPGPEWRSSASKPGLPLLEGAWNPRLQSEGGRLHPPRLQHLKENFW
jgi:hypothetical protein